MNIIYLLLSVLSCLALVLMFLFLKHSHLVLSSLHSYSRQLNDIAKRLSPEEQKELKQKNIDLLHKISKLESNINEQKQEHCAIYSDRENDKKLILKLTKELENNEEKINNYSKAVALVELELDKAERVIKDSELALSKKDLEIRDLNRKLSRQNIELEIAEKKFSRFSIVTKNKDVVVSEKTISEIINILKHSPAASKIVETLITDTRSLYPQPSNNLDNNSIESDWSTCKACGSTSPNLCKCSE